MFQLIHTDIKNILKYKTDNYISFRALTESLIDDFITTVQT